MENWYLDTPNFAPKKRPVDNEDILIVEPRENGKWCFRFSGDSTENRIGNFNTPQEAARVARENCRNVQVVMPPVERGTPAYLPSKTPDEQLLHHLTH